MAKHLLYLTNDNLICLHWRGDAFASRNVFGPQDAYAPEFEQYIAKHRYEKTYLLLDLTEEDFRLDTIPHLRGRDQQAVINRKLNQVYRATTYRHAIIQGREPEGRRDDRVLYHAVSNPDLVKPWLSVLERLGVPLEGIYSAPVLSGMLLKTLDIFFAHTLLVSLVSNNGLRQTYFQNKQIKFSRLTPIEQESESPFGQQVAEETSRTWQYLDSLRFFTPEDTLEVCILIHPRDRPSVADAIRSYPLLQYRILDTDEVAAKINLKPAPASSYAEEIFAQLFAGAPSENHFAAPEQTRNARLRKVGFGLHAMTAGLMVAGLTWAGYTLLQASNIDQEIQTRDRQSRDLMDRYRSLTGQASQAQVSSDTSLDAATFYQTFLRPVPAPGGLLREISQVLTRFPDVKLSQIVWQASDDANLSPPFTPATPKGNPPLKSDPAKADAAALAQAPPASNLNTKELPLPANHFEILVLDAAITSFTGDYRKTLADIERFVAALNGIAGLRATILTSPLDVRPGATIKANLSERTAEPFEGRFAVRIVRNSQGEKSTP